MTERVHSASNLFDFFHEQVASAQQRVHVDLSQDTSLYLATLLAERARSDRPRHPETTLAELHARAAAAPPAEQARTYRELGDSALYVLGYFEESLDRRTVGPSYYAEMGAAAYFRVDRIFKRWFADAFGPVFQELSGNFPSCVEVVGAVRDAHLKDDPEGMFNLYKKWLATGSSTAAARLRELGLILPDGSSEA